jgi:hypothetical protein
MPPVPFKKPTAGSEQTSPQALPQITSAQAPTGGSSIITKPKHYYRPIAQT